MKKRIALLLCLVMVLSVALCACGSSEKDQILGTWEGSINLADAINATLAEGFAADPTTADMAEYMTISSLSIDYTLTFNEDNTYSMVVDEAQVETAMTNAALEIVNGMIEYLGDVLAEAGVEMTVEEYMESMGISLEDLTNELLGEFNIADSLGDLNSEGNFKVSDGKLYMSDGLDYAVDEAVYETYTVESGILTIDKGTAVEEGDEYLYPMVFSKAG